MPSTPAKGNENVSLLEREASKTPPQKSQFTFTCGSDSGSKMIWPGGPSPASSLATPLPAHANSRIPLPVTPGSRRGNHSTQTGHHNMQSPTPNPQGGAPQPPPPGGQANQRPPRPRRSRSAQFRLNARARKYAQHEYFARHGPPPRDDVWICEFCEYESIFGVQPRALITSYEARDRLERKRAEEKRRLLEKAKMKGRGRRKGKGKKGTGGGDNGAGGAAVGGEGGGQMPGAYPDEYFDDGEEDDYGVDEAGGYLPPPPAGPPTVGNTAAQMRDAKIDPGMGDLPEGQMAQKVSGAGGGTGATRQA